MEEHNNRVIGLQSIMESRIMESKLGCGRNNVVSSIWNQSIVELRRKRAYSEKGRTHRLIDKAISPRTRPFCKKGSSGDAFMELHV